MRACVEVQSLPGDLKTRKRTGTSCQIEIHFSIKTTKFLLLVSGLLLTVRSASVKRANQAV